MLASKWQVFVAMFLLVLSNLSMATEIEKKCDYSDWTCHGGHYIAMGAVYLHPLYTHNPISLLPPKITSPRSALPNDGVGPRFGFGGSLLGSQVFSYEMDYAQILHKIKKNDGFQVTGSSKSYTASISYSFNPKERFHSCFLGGVVLVSAYYKSTEVVNNQLNSSISNPVDFFPFIGVSGIYHIDSKFSIKLVEAYEMAPFNKNANAVIATFLMLHYYPA